MCSKQGIEIVALCFFNHYALNESIPSSDIFFHTFKSVILTLLLCSLLLSPILFERTLEFSCRLIHILKFENICCNCRGIKFWYSKNVFKPNILTCNRTKRFELLLNRSLLSIFICLRYTLEKLRFCCL